MCLHHKSSIAERKLLPTPTNTSLRYKSNRTRLWRQWVQQPDTGQMGRSLSSQNMYWMWLGSNHFDKLCRRNQTSTQHSSTNLKIFFTSIVNKKDYDEVRVGVRDQVRIRIRGNISEGMGWGKIEGKGLS
jgi:hypothetical protein